MKIVKKESVNEEEVKSVIIDSSLFQGGQEVEGVALCKYFKEAMTESGKNYVKLYLGDKGHRIFQANMMNINKKNTSTDMINSWVGKPLALKGHVSHFMGMNIVNVIQIDEVKEGIFKDEDFLPTANNIEEELEKFNLHMESVKSEDLQDMRESINRLGVSKALSKAVIEGDNSKIGDGLLICNRMLTQLQELSYEENRIDLDLYKYLIILSTGILYSVSSNKVKNPSTLDTSRVDNLITVMDLINKNDIFGKTHRDRCTKEFKHLYSVLYLGEEPKTFLSKFYRDTEKVIKSNLEAIRLEAKTISGNSYKFGLVEHIRI